MGQKCKKIKEGGETCGAYVLKDGEGFCFFHDERPESVKLRKNAAEAAGKSQKIFFPEVVDTDTEELKEITISKPKDVRKAIIKTLQDIQSKRIEIEIGRTLLYGFNVLIHAIKTVDELEKSNKQDSEPKLSLEEEKEIIDIRKRLSQKLQHKEG